MLERSIRWRPLAGVGLEHCHVVETSQGLRVRSVVIGDDAATSFGVSYDIRLTTDWVFRRLSLARTDGALLELSSDGRGNWQDGAGTPMPALQGCVDIDISGTPFTNTLPIRRGAFEPGRPQRFSMAWIALDSLTAIRDEQIYTHLDDRHYRYQAADGSFEQVLEVDEDGFVVDYPTLFARVSG